MDGLTINCLAFGILFLVGAGLAHYWSEWCEDQEIRNWRTVWKVDPPTWISAAGYRRASTFHLALSAVLLTTGIVRLIG